MSSLSTAKLYFELSNSRDLDAIEKIIHPEAIYNSDTTWLFFWKESIMKMMRSFFEKFSYLLWEIESFGEVTSWITEIHFHATFRNQSGEILKSGKEKIIVHDGIIRYIEVTNI